MKEMIINGTDVSQGRVVKALEAMLDGADDATLREFHCYKWDEQFYELGTDVIPITFMIKKEFNCLIVWYTHCGPTSFNGGDEVVQKQYHPCCILDKKRHEDDPNDVCRDIANGLIRSGLLNADDYIGFKED